MDSCFDYACQGGIEEGLAQLHRGGRIVSRGLFAQSNGLPYAAILFQFPAGLLILPALANSMVYPEYSDAILLALYNLSSYLSLHLPYVASGHIYSQFSSAPGQTYVTTNKLLSPQFIGIMKLGAPDHF
ncbi:unnamed protein product [Protopolystoma xenopodis]|uniref:Uncharacterized protein n=1 Tax=Protopolystoma xenopodis TaxID=117903 RepID=A0A3S5FCG8_9PLAT|nr:unnamed protein product [Protopolystoma xenopodis]